MSHVRDQYGCVLVTSRLDRDGYAYHGSSRAHIVAWVAAHGGPVPEGMVLDHMCRRRNCRALIHLEPVTQSENELRKRWAYRIKRKVCSSGHDLTLHRQVTPEGGIVCRRCSQGAG